MACELASSPVNAVSLDRGRWWREKECWLLAALVLAVYFSRPTALSLRGEETRWAGIAREMLLTGDFVVPRQQGEVFANRPPLTNWCLALSMKLTGGYDPWTVRLPTLLATLATSLILYAQGRRLLSRFAALTAGLAYATMGQVLQLGRLAESDAVLTVFVTASLVGWIVNYQCAAAPWITWCVGYGFAALAALAKGPQGPVYFFGSTWIFCLLFDRSFWRRREHLYGLLLFIGILAAWQVPLMIQSGFRSAMGIWFAETTGHIALSIPLKDRLLHLFKFPWVALVCMLPWSGLLLGFCRTSIRNNLGSLRRPAIFFAITLTIGILPLLIAVHARGRYFMPLYPCAAMLAAMVVEVSLLPAIEREATRTWRTFLLVLAVVAPASALYVAVVSYLPSWSQTPYGQSTLIVSTFALAAAATAWLCIAAIKNYNQRTSSFAAYAIAGFCGFAYTVVILNAYQARASDPHGNVAKALENIPRDAELVSFSTIHHLFAFYVAHHSDRSIRRADFREALRPDGVSWEYFCFNCTSPPPPLPFAWEQVATASMERNSRENPADYVVIARRLPSVKESGSQSPALRSIRR